MDKEKLERLQKVMSKIEKYSSNEIYFNDLEEIRKQEYRLEGGKSAIYVMGNYRHNLEQTGWKQAESYKVAKRKRPVKGAPSEYVEYVRNFKQDVQEELYRVQIFIDNQN